MFRKLFGTGLVVGVFALPTAEAALVPWVGSADYTQAPGAFGDEETVGPFDSYDFANGVALVQANVVANPGVYTIGDTFVGYYQSYVTLHQLNGVGVDPNPSKLDKDGVTNGDQGYELTVTATFQTQVAGVDGLGNATFLVTGGMASLNFDTNPNYSFLGDSGFSDGASIISANIIAGSGAFLPAFGTGFSDVTLSIAPLGFDSLVYDPPTLAGGDGIFTLKVNNTGTGPTAGVGNVMGIAVNLAGGDALLEADGNLKLYAVPEPVSMLLVGTALAGVVAIKRRYS